MRTLKTNGAKDYPNDIFILGTINYIKQLPYISIKKTF
jgi:hypothetical protein